MLRAKALLDEVKNSSINAYELKTGLSREKLSEMMDGFLYALITFMIVDYATGIMCAIIDKKLSSEVGFRGIFKKVMILIMVGIANAVDKHVIGSARQSERRWCFSI